jgi:redox-sensitive bicupin YhaK (pirin superfamily)
MTAGRGIAHAEISANRPGRVHAAQLWIALPDAERHREPSFHHYPELPILESGGFTVTVLAGSAFGKAAPAMVFSPLVAMDLSCSGAAQLAVPLNPAFEHGAMVLAGAVEVEGEPLEPGSLLYLGSDRPSVSVRCDTAARLLLIGGEPFKEEVLLWWNFVARSPEEMAEATEQWNSHRHFGEVQGTTLPRLIAPDIKGLSLRRPAK